MIKAGIEVLPIVNQFEVSPAMFRPKLIEYFQEKKVLVSASKSLHRGSSFSQGVVDIAGRHHTTPAQVFLRWGMQKGLIVVAKTSKKIRMVENRSLFTFSLDEGDMAHLDQMTTADQIREREELEEKRKTIL